MALKLATKADYTDIIRMYLDFAEASPHDLEPDPEKVINLLDYMISKGPKEATVILATDDEGKVVGMLGAMAQETLYYKGRIGVEMFWWVDPSARKGTTHGKELLEAFEYWGGKVGCTKLQLSLLETEQAKLLDRVYTKKGYRLVERSYLKDM